MTDELLNFPELVTDPSKFSYLRSECEKIIGLRKRLPDFVFEKRFAKYYVIEQSLVFWKTTPSLLSRVAKMFGDDSVNYITIIPDAVDYYRRHFSFFGLACFEPANLEDRYLPVMKRGGAVDSFLARGGDVGALWGSSLKWAIATDRISWELAVVAAQEDVDVSTLLGCPCFNAKQVTSYITNLYHMKDPSDSIANEFSRRFLTNYPV